MDPVPLKSQTVSVPPFPAVSVAQMWTNHRKLVRVLGTFEFKPGFTKCVLKRGPSFDTNLTPSAIFENFGQCSVFEVVVILN